MDSKLTLIHAQTLVDEWIQTYGVRYFSPLTNMAILTEEVGEVARAPHGTSIRGSELQAQRRSTQPR